MSRLEAFKNGVTLEPIMIADPAGTFAIVGSHDHGVRIPQASVPKLVRFLEGVEALKMEGEENMEGAFRLYHPISTEVLVKACFDPSQFSWITESDGEDRGQKLARNGVTKEIMEIAIPSWIIRDYQRLPENIGQILPEAFTVFKRHFSFIDTPHATESFLKVVNYWRRHTLDLIRDLTLFSYDFTEFQGKVREFEYWRPDLRRFRTDHLGRIGVCCGLAHLSSVQLIIEGKDLEKPDWENHIDKSNDPVVMDYRNELKMIYRNLEVALNE
jgi:hypothetical protein